MIASKLVITSETRAKLNNPVLTPAKKLELREQLIVEYIRKNLRPITKQELIVAGGYNASATSQSYANGLNLITRMIKRNVISHNNTKEFRKLWTVTEDVKVRPIAQKITELPAMIPKDSKLSQYQLTLEPVQELKKESLIDMAKQWAWENNSDSLRDFIAFAQNRVK